MEDRKKDHIDLAFESRIEVQGIDNRFYYEPLLSAHPSGDDFSIEFLGKTLKNPIWVSSMTGGTQLAKTINKNLALACKEFGMGMGLGSCRIILRDDKYLKDFQVRQFIGDEAPLYANLGIAQIETLLDQNEVHLISELIKKLEADGLFIHVNPLQELFQPEGDRIKYSPIETIKRVLEQVDFPIAVKEVGQGMGPESLKALLQLPLKGIEFAAFGGTNFSKMEILRNKVGLKDSYFSMANVGHSAEQMIEYINAQFIDPSKLPDIIISGGIKNFLDGYYYMNKINAKAIYGQASSFLKHAMGSYEELQQFAQTQVEGLKIAKAYLRIK